MWRRVSRDDFEQARPLVAPLEAVEGRWSVCEEYEIKEMSSKAQYHFEEGLYKGVTAQGLGEYAPRPANLYGHGIFPAEFVNKYKERGYLFRYLIVRYPLDKVKALEKWRFYNPAKEVPGLFLSFARLYNSAQEYSEDQILDWVERYGLLGIDGFSGLEEGGCLHSLAGFVWEIYWAAGMLAMYEAVLNRDEEAAKRALLGEFLHVAPHYLDPNSRHLEASNRDIDDSTRAEMVKRLVEGDYLRYALMIVLRCMHARLRRNCYPSFRTSQEEDPFKVELDFGYENLLGAMYLQFYWLITSGGDLANCEHCGRILSLSRPHPEGRKRRQDRRFCDDACRMAYHRSKKKA